MKYFFFVLFIILSLISCNEDQPSINNPNPASESEVFEDKLLFSKNPNGHNEIYLLEGNEERLILSDPLYDFWWAKVHPDKTKFLVYRSPVNPEMNHDAYENAELVLSNIDGSNSQVIIKLSDYGWKSQGVCRWNKDGSKILMCAEVPFNNTYQWRLISTNDQGRNAKILSHHWAIDCNFSKDDSEIVFMGFTNNQLDFDLTKLELQRGTYDQARDTVIDVAALTNNFSRDHDPDYAPDNNRIVFSGGNASYSDVDLLIYDIEKEEQTILLDDNRANGGSMSWSQDGKHVVFHSLDLFNTPFQIRVIHVASREVTTLLAASDNAHGYFHPETY